MREDFYSQNIVRAARDLENEAKKIINWNLERNEGKSERIEYVNPGKVLIELIKAHGLEQKSLTEEVLVCFSSDAGDFLRNRGHTSIG